MGSSKIPISTAFAPSPPLSASASPGTAASDYEFASDTAQPGEGDDDLHALRPDERRRRRPQARTDSSPLSLASDDPARARARGKQPRSIPSALSSFASDAAQEVPIQTTERPEDPGLEDNSVGAVLSLVKASWKGTLPDDLPSPEWCTFKITPAQYVELYRRLEDHGLLVYFEDLRYDWDPENDTLVLRLMATSLHETLQESICDEIKSQLRDLAAHCADDVLSSHVAEVHSRGHAKVTLTNKAKRVGGVKQKTIKSKRSPDARFNHGKTIYPQFIMETAHSQHHKDLQCLAKQYYQGSRGEIKTVLTIDVEYRSPEERQEGGSHPAVFCLYRGPKRVHRNIPLRDDDGNPTDTGVQLFLSDFLSDDALGRLSRARRRQAEKTALTLSSQQLCQFLATAEEAQAVEDAAETTTDNDDQNPDVAGPRSSKKRRLPSTPPVDWDVDTDEGRGSHDGDAHDDADDGSDGEQAAPRSKRRRTGSAEGYRPPHRPNALPERQRTLRQSRSQTREVANV